MCGFVNILNRVIEKESPLDRFDQKATMSKYKSAMRSDKTGTEKDIDKVQQSLS